MKYINMFIIAVIMFLLSGCYSQLVRNDTESYSSTTTYLTPNQPQTNTSYYDVDVNYYDNYYDYKYYRPWRLRLHRYYYWHPFYASYYYYFNYGPYYYGHHKYSHKIHKHKTNKYTRLRNSNSRKYYRTKKGHLQHIKRPKKSNRTYKKNRPNIKRNKSSRRSIGKYNHKTGRSYKSPVKRQPKSRNSRRRK